MYEKLTKNYSETTTAITFLLTTHASSDDSSGSTMVVLLRLIRAAYGVSATEDVLSVAAVWWSRSVGNVCQ